MSKTYTAAIQGALIGLSVLWLGLAILWAMRGSWWDVFTCVSFGAITSITVLGNVDRKGWLGRRM